MITLQKIISFLGQNLIYINFKIMTRIYKIFLFTFIVLFFSNINLVAQQDPEARKVLDKVAKTYKGMSAYKAEFNAKLKKATGGTESLKGEIIVKGNKFYLKMSDQTVINNGTYVWTFLKDENEVVRAKYDPAEEDITPDKIVDIYKKGYKYKFVNKNLVEGGRSFYEIMLVPQNKNGNIINIIIKVAKNNNIVKRWEINQRDGNKDIFTVTRLVNVTVGDSYFKYNSKKFPKGHIYTKLD